MVLDEQKGHGCHFANFRLSQMAAGLVLTDSDLAFHLESLVLREHNLIGFADHWRDVVEWALLNPERFAVAERVARAQAETRPELQAIVTEIESRPSPAWEREEEQRQRRWELKERGIRTCGMLLAINWKTIMPATIAQRDEGSI